jgi:hypothetical protein
MRFISSALVGVACVVIIFATIITVRYQFFCIQNIACGRVLKSLKSGMQKRVLAEIGH